MLAFIKTNSLIKIQITKQVSPMNRFFQGQRQTEKESARHLKTLLTKENKIFPSCCIKKNVGSTFT
jgi:hypothetical protein